MKKLLLICLLAGYHHCFAQNLFIGDLERVLTNPSPEWINQYLAPKGYAGGIKEVKGEGAYKADAYSWGFKSDQNPGAPMMAALNKITDTAGTKVVYETSNVSLYTNLVNQLPINSFQFKQTATTGNRITLIFTNIRYELSLHFAQDARLEKPYTITLRLLGPQPKGPQVSIRVNQW